MIGTFRALQHYNYRVWAIGAIVSNVGTWMQRVAQDWIVLVQLTHHNAQAVGLVMACQFGPQLLLLPLSGYIADHLDRRRTLIATQAGMGLLALGLGLLTVTGLITLWEVYVFAFVQGCLAAIDAPARQTFVSELVDETHLSNAVALNSTSFNAGRTVGPAIAGLLIATVGTGWVFLINAASFVAVLVAMGCLRIEDLHRRERPRVRGKLSEGLVYIWNRPDLKACLFMLLFLGTFGLNFPIFVSTMAVGVFHKGAGQFGLLTSCLAVGSVSGALLAARRARPRITLLLAGAGFFGGGMALAAGMPNYGLFAAVLVIVGMSVQTFTTSTNSLMQLSTEPALRGRVMAIYVAVALGTTPVGGPIIGWAADHFGPRWAMVIGASGGFCALLVGLRYLVIHRHARLVRENGRWRFSLDPEGILPAK